jgi:putative intracellular protease/amidase/YHS domain-containing protein
MKHPLAACASCIALLGVVLLPGCQAAGSTNQTSPAASIAGRSEASRDPSATPPADQPPAEDPALRLTPPVDGRITIAVVLAPDAEVVDFAGPWGVFEYANIPNLDKNPFELFTVAESTAPVRCSGGLTIVPDHTFANAPNARIILIPAMGEPSPALLNWVREACQRTDLTMSVCNGSFVLAKAGLLAGKTVTSHHGGYGLLAATYPDVTVKRGARFVDDGRISTAGGLTSGIDLALHIVERYYGRAAAEQTSLDLEYQGTGWKDPNSNAMFAAAPVSTDDRPVCPICEMAVDKVSALSEVYKGRTVYFCGKSCQEAFGNAPDKFVKP